MYRPVRILHVIGKMDRGGAETMLMNLYRQIDRDKVQFDFLVHSYEKGQFDEEIIEMGGMIHHIPKFNGLNIYSYYQEVKRFFQKYQNYKIVHGHIGSTAPIYLYLAKKNNNTFRIAHSHNTNNNITLKGKLHRLITWPTKNVADFFFACSNAAGVDRFGERIVKSNKFEVFNNAIKASDFAFSEPLREKVRKEFGVDDKFVIGHIGRFNIQKNHDFIIDVFYNIKKSNKDAVLMLVGDGELKLDIQEKVKKLNLEDSVVFTGVRTDISYLLQALDVFLFPSIYEGLGIVVIEAQASGLKCVVSDQIPKEAHITDLVTSLSLKDHINIWEEKVNLHPKNYTRTNQEKEIKNNGYDIEDTAKWLTDFYLNRVT